MLAVTGADKRGTARRPPPSLPRDHIDHHARLLAVLAAAEATTEAEQLEISDWTAKLLERTAHVEPPPHTADAPPRDTHQVLPCCCHDYNVPGFRVNGFHPRKTPGITVVNGYYLKAIVSVP